MHDLPHAVLAALAQGPATIAELAARAFPTRDALDGRRMVCVALQSLLEANNVQGPIKGQYSLLDPGSLQAQALRRRPLDQVLPVAEALLEELSPFAIKLKIAGSISRQQPDVGDIELCALVESAPALLDDITDEPDKRLRDALADRAALILKKGPRYTQVILDADPIGGIKVDLFQTSSPHEWGMLCFIRTGSADFVRRALGHWKTITHGGFCKDNRLRLPDGTLVDTTAEHQVFTNLKCPWVPPHLRIPKEESSA